MIGAPVADVFVPPQLSQYVKGTHLGRKITLIVQELPELPDVVGSRCDMCEYDAERKKGSSCALHCPGERNICLDPKNADAYLIAQVTRRIVGDA